MVLRFGWRSLALRDAAGQPADLLAWLRRVPLTGPGEAGIGVHTQGRTYAVRLIACRLSQQAAQAARRRIGARARRKGQVLQREKSEAAGFLLVLTDLQRAAGRPQRYSTCTVSAGKWNRSSN